MRNEGDLRAGLDAAAAAGLIESAQVAALAAFLGQRSARATVPVADAPAQVAGEEDLRFVRNFHDVFLATGIVLLAIGLAIAVAVATEQLSFGGIWIPAALLAGAAGVMWSLGEVFARKRRLFLPSIAICISFVSFAIFAAMLFYGGVVGERAGTFWDKLGEAEFVVRASGFIAASVGLVACLGFYARFKLPFSMGLSGLFGVLSLMGGLIWFAPDVVEQGFSAIMLVGGLCMFLLGVWFDTRDPARATRISDNGFWLHFGAAPLILNGVLNLAGGVYNFCDEYSAKAGYCQESGLSAAIIALAVVGLLGFISLLINRRALIVSALFTTGIAVGALMKAVGMDAGALAASTLVVLGAGVLVLGAGWHDLRRVLLRRLPIKGFWRKVFPPEETMVQSDEGAPTIAVN